MTTFKFQKIGRRSAYIVTAVQEGSSKVVGTVKRKWFAHIEMHGWEATGPDGHRAVHNHRWQAAEALVWDGKGYPFPIAKHA